MLGLPAPDPLTFALRSSCGNCVLSLEPSKGPSIEALKLPDWLPWTFAARLTLSFPLVIEFGLLNVWWRTCLGSTFELELELELPQAATAAGTSAARAIAARRVLSRVKAASSVSFRADQGTGGRPRRRHASPPPP